MLSLHSDRSTGGSPVSLNFNAADPVQLARELVRAAGTPGQSPPCLLIDCRAVTCRHTRGLGYFIDQLLMIRRTGARIQLLHPDVTLRRALHLLRLHTLFELPADAAAGAA